MAERGYRTNNGATIAGAGTAASATVPTAAGNPAEYSGRQFLVFVRQHGRGGLRRVPGDHSIHTSPLWYERSNTHLRKTWKWRVSRGCSAWDHPQRLPRTSG